MGDDLKNFDDDNDDQWSNWERVQRRMREREKIRKKPRQTEFAKKRRLKNIENPEWKKKHEMELQKKQEAIDRAYKAKLKKERALQKKKDKAIIKTVEAKLKKKRKENKWKKKGLTKLKMEQQQAIEMKYHEQKTQEREEHDRLYGKQIKQRKAEEKKQADERKKKQEALALKYKNKKPLILDENNNMWTAIESNNMDMLERISLYYPKNLRNKQKTQKNTAIHWCVKHNRPEMIRFLIPLIPKYLNTQNFYGNTPVMLAVFDSNIECIEALHSSKKYKCDLDIRNIYGRTPLMKACMNNQINIVKYFLANNTPSLDIQDKQNQSALLYAIEHKRDKIVNILVSKGAKTNIKNNQGHTGIDKAKGIKTKIALEQGKLKSNVNVLNSINWIKKLDNANKNELNNIFEIILKYTLSMDLDAELKKIKIENAKKKKKSKKKKPKRAIGARRPARRGRGRGRNN